MTKPTPNPDPVQVILGRLKGVKQTGKEQWQARCPAHDDCHASLSVARGEDGRALVHCHAGCAVADILAAVGLETGDLFPRTPAKQRHSASRRMGEQKRGRRIVATHDYEDAEGKLLFQVVRYDPKDFRQRRPDGKGGWTWNLKGVPRVPYRLPELLAADPSAWVFVPEGEKDVDNLRGVGLVATTNPGGKGKWKHLADDSAIHGRRVAIIPDNDKDGGGMVHAQDVAARLYGRAADVRVVELPGEFRDVSEWLDSLDSKEPEDVAAALVAMAEAAPVWTPEAEAPGLSRPVLTCLADVQPQPVRWLWPQRIALGKLTLLAGDPGLGKSCLTLDVAARVSRGNGWPDSPAATGAPAGVVLLSAEDDLADTIRPRLDAAGADVLRIMALEAVKVRDPEAGTDRPSPFSLAADLPELARAISATRDCRLVVIDPITAYLGRADSHKNAEIRALLAPLSELAARCDVAIVAVTHLRKGEGPAMYRAMGSLAFVAAARAVFGVARDPDDATGERRFMLPVKNNLGNDRDGLAYRLLAPAGGVPAVAWEAQPVHISADEALGPPPAKRPGPDPQERNEAVEWLRDALAEGPRPVRDLLTEAKKDGISEGTLKRAKKQIGAVAGKVGWDAGWVWRLAEGGQ